MCDVLIVDDDPGAVDAFQHMLRKQHYDIVVAGDAEAAFRVMARTTPGAMLVDFHLPRMNGVEFLNQVRTIEEYADVPAALITGDYLIDDDVVRALERLGARIVFKPLWKEDLVTLVGALRAQRHSHDRDRETVGS